MSVTTMLKIRWTGTPAMGLLALSVAILAALLLPGRAEAQQQEQAATKAATNTATNTATVVGAGDSLWTIAQARLAPDASPQQVVAETERIYGLNRDRIGNDPNFVLAGQEILLEPVADPVVASREPRANDEELTAASDRVPGSATPAAPETASSAEQPAGEEVVPAGATAEGNEEPAAEPAEESAAEPAAEPAAEEAPSSSEPKGVIEGIAGARQLLGLTLLLLGVVLAIILVWRLRREFGPNYREGYRRYSESYALPRQTEREQTEKEGEEQAPEVEVPEQAEVETTDAETSTAPATTGRAGLRQPRLRRIRVNRTPGGK